MRTDTPSCRVGWDLVLEEPQESFNPTGTLGQSGKGGREGPFLGTPLFHLGWCLSLLSSGFVCGLGIDPILSTWDHLVRLHLWVKPFLNRSSFARAKAKDIWNLPPSASK